MNIIQQTGKWGSSLRYCYQVCIFSAVHYYKIYNPQIKRPSWLTFKVDLDDVVATHQVAAGQQLRHFRGVGANHLTHPVADNTVWAETQAGQRIHAEYILLQRGWTVEL